MTSLHELELEERLVAARRALLAHPLLVAGHPCFGTVRAHGERLRREFRDELGYELVIRAEHARLRKRSDRRREDRPARIPRSGVHPDGWPAFTRRHYAVLAIALAACEQSRPQTSIGLLAEEVRSIAVEEGVELNLDRYEDRRLLADVLTALGVLGVLTLVAGRADGWVRSRHDEDEALYDVHHGRLDDLLIAPGVIGATCADDLLDWGVYAPTDEGANLRRRHRISRLLVEEPALYLADLDEADRAYYTNPAVRGPRDERLAAWLGLVAERRREGTALVDPDAVDPLSDLRFPVARPWERQVALLLAERICARVRAGRSRVLDGELRDDCRALLDRWGDALCPEDPDEMLRRALDVLTRMALVRRSDGEAIPLPALARFGEVDMSAAQQRLMDDA